MILYYHLKFMSLANISFDLPHEARSEDCYAWRWIFVWILHLWFL